MSNLYYNYRNDPPPHPHPHPPLSQSSPQPTIHSTDLTPPPLPLSSLPLPPVHPPSIHPTSFSQPPPPHSQPQPQPWNDSSLPTPTTFPTNTLNQPRPPIPSSRPPQTASLPPRRAPYEDPLLQILTPKHFPDNPTSAPPQTSQSNPTLSASSLLDQYPQLRSTSSSVFDPSDFPSLNPPPLSTPASLLDPSATSQTLQQQPHQEPQQQQHHLHHHQPPHLHHHQTQTQTQAQQPPPPPPQSQPQQLQHPLPSRSALSMSNHHLNTLPPYSDLYSLPSYTDPRSKPLDPASSQEFHIQNEDFPALGGVAAVAAAAAAAIHTTPSGPVLSTQPSTSLPAQPSSAAVNSSASSAVRSQRHVQAETLFDSKGGPIVSSGAGNMAARSGLSAEDSLGKGALTGAAGRVVTGLPAVNEYGMVDGGLSKMGGGLRTGRGDAVGRTLRTVSGAMGGGFTTRGVAGNLVGVGRGAEDVESGLVNGEGHAGANGGLIGVEKKKGHGVLPPDQFGMKGLLKYVGSEAEGTDANLLSIGVDLTMLGLDLNSADPLYKTFSNPWEGGQGVLSGGDTAGSAGGKGEEPDFKLPACYYMQPPALKTSHFTKFQVETLFYVFYNMPRDVLQVLAALELYNRKWMYHKDLKLWFHQNELTEIGQGYERGAYVYFDIKSWEQRPFHDANKQFIQGLMTEEELRAVHIPGQRPSAS